MNAIDVLWVGVGGGIGSLLRWQLGRYIEKRVGSSLRFGTFFINVTGAFVIAYISAALALGWEQRYGSLVSSLVLTGILGGYTTFSTMQLDAVQLSDGRGHAVAAGYLGASVAVGLAAAALGVSLARMWA